MSWLRLAGVWVDHAPAAAPASAGTSWLRLAGVWVDHAPAAAPASAGTSWLRLAGVWVDHAPEYTPPAVDISEGGPSDRLHRVRVRDDEDLLVMMSLVMRVLR